MAKTNTPEPKPAFIFFNCDEIKSQGSMNIFWENNRVVYRDLKGARKILWEKVQSEIESGRVHIDEANMETARSLVLEGDPTQAGQYMHNGAIVRVDCY